MRSKCDGVVVGVHLCPADGTSVNGKRDVSGCVRFTFVTRDGVVGDLCFHTCSTDPYCNTAGRGFAYMASISTRVSFCCTGRESVVRDCCIGGTNNDTLTAAGCGVSSGNGVAFDNSIFSREIYSNRRHTSCIGRRCRLQITEINVTVEQLAALSEINSRSEGCVLFGSYREVFQGVLIGSNCRCSFTRIEDEGLSGTIEGDGFSIERQ